MLSFLEIFAYTVFFVSLIAGGIGVRLLFNNKKSIKQRSVPESDSGQHDTAAMQNGEASLDELTCSLREQNTALESVENRLSMLQETTSKWNEEINSSLNRIQTELTEFKFSFVAKSSVQDSGLVEEAEEDLGFRPLRNAGSTLEKMTRNDEHLSARDPIALAEDMSTMSLDSKKEVLAEIRNQLETDVGLVRKGILALIRAEEILGESSKHEINYGSIADQDPEGRQHTELQVAAGEREDENLLDAIEGLIEEDKKNNLAFRERINALTQEMNNLMEEVDSQEAEVENLQETVESYVEQEEKQNSAFPEPAGELAEEVNNLMEEVDPQDAKGEDLKEAVVNNNEQEETQNSAFPERISELAEEVDQLMYEADEGEEKDGDDGEERDLTGVIETLAEEEKKENNAFIERINKLMEQVYEEEVGKLSAHANKKTHHGFRR